MKIALISCSKTKANYACAAKEMYAPSDLFIESYKYARREADRVYIFSTKYGLLHEDAIIEPYETPPTQMDNEWANGVVTAIRRECDVDTDEFIILAGKAFYLGLIPHLPHYCLPLGKMLIDDRIDWLKQRNADAAQKHI